MNQENLNKDWKDNKKTCPFCGASQEVQQTVEWEHVYSIPRVIAGEDCLVERVTCLDCGKEYYRLYKVTEVIQSVDFYTEEDDEMKNDIVCHWTIDSDGNLKKGYDHPQYVGITECRRWIIDSDGNMNMTPDHPAYED